MSCGLFLIMSPNGIVPGFFSTFLPTVFSPILKPNIHSGGGGGGHPGATGGAVKFSISKKSGTGGAGYAAFTRPDVVKGCAMGVGRRA